METKVIIDQIDRLSEKDSRKSDGGLARLSKYAGFGESESEPLSVFLSCEAFEARFEPRRAAAFRLAALIVSRHADNHSNTQVAES